MVEVVGGPESVCRRWEVLKMAGVAAPAAAKAASYERDVRES
jgi:hypothetical protein